MHVWFVVCISFIFIALIELAIALIYVQKVADWKERESRESREQRCISDVLKAEVQDTTPCDSDIESTEQKIYLRKPSLPFAKRASIFTLGGDGETFSGLPCKSGILSAEEQKLIQQSLSGIHVELPFKRIARKRIGCKYFISTITMTTPMYSCKKCCNQICPNCFYTNYNHKCTGWGQGGNMCKWNAPDHSFLPISQCVGPYKPYCFSRLSTDDDNAT